MKLSKQRKDRELIITIKRERKEILNKLLKDPFVQSEDKIGSRIAEVFDSMAIRQEKEMASTLQKIEAKFDILE